MYLVIARAPLQPPPLPSRDSGERQERGGLRAAAQQYPPLTAASLQLAPPKACATQRGFDLPRDCLLKLGSTQGGGPPPVRQPPCNQGRPAGPAQPLQQRPVARKAPILTVPPPGGDVPARGTPPIVVALRRRGFTRLWGQMVRAAGAGAVAGKQGMQGACAWRRGRKEPAPRGRVPARGGRCGRLSSSGGRAARGRPRAGGATRQGCSHSCCRAAAQQSRLLPEARASGAAAAAAAAARAANHAANPKRRQHRLRRPAGQRGQQSASQWKAASMRHAHDGCACSHAVAPRAQQQRLGVASAEASACTAVPCPLQVVLPAWPPCRPLAPLQ